MKSKNIKAKAARYLKVVEWSDEDKCFVGRVPGLFAGGVHGDDEAEVYRELCQATEEWIANIEGDGKPLPPATAGRNFSGKFVVRTKPELHQKAVLKAMARNKSLNQFVEDAIAAS
jgi:predicted HicB family RNase H-like nuclease